MSRELISKETRTDIREYLASWMLPRIESAFRAAEVHATADYHPPVIGTRRVMVERYYRSLDFTKPPDAEKFVRVCEEVVRDLIHRRQSEPEKSIQYQATRDHILHALRRDGFAYENSRFVAIDGAGPALAEFHPDALARTVARIERGIDANPLAAIGSATNLVERCCTAILAARGKPVTDGRAKRVTALVRRVATELDLLPNGREHTAGSVSSILGSLVKVFQNAADRPSRTHGLNGATELTACRAKLAVGAAATLTAFLFEAHEARLAG